MRYLGPTYDRLRTPEEKEQESFLRKKVGQLRKILETTGQKFGVLRGKRADGTPWMVRVIGTAAGKPIVQVQVQVWARGSEAVFGAEASYFVFLPADSSNPDGWGEPFYSEGARLNGIWGTPGGDRAESLLSDAGATLPVDRRYRHLRAINNYDGRFSTDLELATGYGLYNWHGRREITLSICDGTGDRYFGYGTSSAAKWGSLVFYEGRVHSVSPGQRLIVGAGVAGFDAEYLYVVVIAPGAATRFAETFEVWRKPWDPGASASKDIPWWIPAGFSAVAGAALTADLPAQSGAFYTEDTAWVKVGEVPHPDYEALYQPYAYFTYATPPAWDADPNRSGLIGGAAFSPDGTRFVMSFRIFVDRPPLGDDAYWIVGHLESTLSGETGDTVTTVLHGNTFRATPGVPYMLAADYDNATGSLVRFSTEVAVLSGVSPCSDAMRYSTFTLGARTFVGFKTGAPAGDIINALFLYIDLRFTAACGQYIVGTKGAGESASIPDYEYGYFRVDSGTASARRRTAGGSPPAFTDVFAGVQGLVDGVCVSEGELVGLPWLLINDWMWSTDPTIGFCRYGVCNRRGTLLAAYPNDFVRTEAPFYGLVGGGTPPAMTGYETSLPDVADVTRLLGMPQGAMPGLVYLGVV